MKKIDSTGKIALFMFKTLYRPLVKRSARQILQGRFLNLDDREKGRFLRGDVDEVLRATWRNVDELLPRAGLAQLPTLGNRHNVFLAVVTTAAYRALLEFGVERTYAADLINDVGWKLYSLGIQVASWPFAISTRDSGKRIERTIRMLMVFPFSAPGRPGYEVKITRQPVVHQFEFSFFLYVFGRPGFGATASTISAIHSRSRSVPVKPASIAGETRNVL